MDHVYHSSPPNEPQFNEQKYHAKPLLLANSPTMTASKSLQRRIWPINEPIDNADNLDSKHMIGDSHPNTAVHNCTSIPNNAVFAITTFLVTCS